MQRKRSLIGTIIDQLKKVPKSSTPSTAVRRTTWSTSWPVWSPIRSSQKPSLHLSLEETLQLELLAEAQLLMAYTELRQTSRRCRSVGRTSTGQRTGLSFRSEDRTSSGKGISGDSTLPGTASVLAAGVRGGTGWGGVRCRCPIPEWGDGASSLAQCQLADHFFENHPQGGASALAPSVPESEGQSRNGTRRDVPGSCGDGMAGKYSQGRHASLLDDDR